jgi:hypothetical protein
MKITLWMGIFLLSLSGFSCKETKSPNQSARKELDFPHENQDSASHLWRKDTLIREARLSYFLPSGLQNTSICIFFLDPQGEGWEPLGLYQNLARKYGIGMVGSNVSKNGMDLEQEKRVAQEALEEIRKGTGSDSLRFYLAGFSGGARASLALLSLMPDWKGAVYAGAPGQARNYQKAIFGFAGTKDMNYADLLTFDQSLGDASPHFLLEWDGKHTWPDPVFMEDAFIWQKIREEYTTGLQDQIQLEILQKATKEKDVLRKMMYFRQILQYGSSQNLQFKLQNFEKTPTFLQARERRNQELNKELKLKEEYGKAIFEKDMAWWETEISALQNKTRFLEKAMQDRLLGYFSLVSYSLCHRALQEKQWPLLEKILFIYQKCDPENPEAWYLAAILSVVQQDTSRALQNLEKCKGLGFKDASRFEQDTHFQEFRKKVDFRF